MAKNITELDKEIYAKIIKTAMRNFPVFEVEHSVIISTDYRSITFPAQPILPTIWKGREDPLWAGMAIAAKSEPGFVSQLVLGAL